MDKKYILNSYSFEKLSEKYDLSKFDCGSSDLNDFIKNDALKQQKDNLNITRLIICDNEIIGFFSLLADTIKINRIRDEITVKSIKEQKPRVKQLPAVKIGRFGISTKYTNQGIGSHILRNVLYNIKIISQDIGLRFIIVEGYAKAYNFYVKYNSFNNLKKDDEILEKLERIIKTNPNHTFYLYRDINTLNPSINEN